MLNSFSYVNQLIICLLTFGLFGWCSGIIAQETSQRGQRIFDRFDTDENGQLEKSEFPARLQETFGMIDSDQNQSVSIDEFKRVIQKFSGKRSASSTDREKKQPQPYEYYGSKDEELAIDRIEKLVLQDKKRNKDLQLRLTFPKSSGPFPVIVFSHGLYGSKDNYLPLTEFWASHGYVVIQVNHADSLKLGTRLGDPRALLAWDERPRDISFIIDALQALNEGNEQLKGKLNLEKIGVGGHSFGAGTTQLVAGANAIGGKKTMNFADPRLDAALLMSSQGPGGILTEDSWKSVTKPMMVMSGSKDGPTRTGQPAAWRKKPYELSPPGDKFLVWIEGLDHGFGDVTESAMFSYNADHIAWTQATTLAFWDDYLKQSESAKEFLKEKKITAQTDGKVQVDWK